MSLKRDNLIAISNLPGGGGGGLGRGGGPGGGPGGFGIVAIDISLSQGGPSGVSPQSASMWLSSVDRMLMPASLARLKQIGRDLGRCETKQPVLAAGNSLSQCSETVLLTLAQSGSQQCRSLRSRARARVKTLHQPAF